MVDVFISYRRVERGKVEPIKNKLESLGLSVFFDVHGIDGGADFPTVIDTNLRAAKLILACWSPLYFERKPPPDWCMIECRFGLGQQKLVPIAVERFASDAPPVELHGVNYFDLTAWRGQYEHENWQRTVRALSRHVGRELCEPEPHAVPWHDLVSEQVRPSLDPGVPRSLGSATLGTSRPARAQNLGIQHAFQIELAQRPGWPKPEMIVIPPGKFLMGSESKQEGLRNHDEEMPVREVEIAHAFALGKHPVTLAEYAVFVAEAKHEVSASDVGKFKVREAVRYLEGLLMTDDQLIQVMRKHASDLHDYRSRLGNWQDPGFEQSGSHPVCCISWDDAQAYLRWLNEVQDSHRAYRLPSEAEWEFACRAGTTTLFNFGSTVAAAQASFNHAFERAQTARQHPTPVGSFPANPFGLHDMHGNVWEWCQDVWHDDYQGAPKDGSAWTANGDPTERVVRGGSWYSGPGSLRSTARKGVGSDIRSDIIGFRVAATL